MPAATFLLPPSEGKATGGRGRWRPGGGSFRRLGVERTSIATALAAVMLDPVASAKLLGVKGEALAEARRVNANLMATPALPAAERYQGVVWGHLAPADLSEAALERARQGVIVLSALVGAARFGDPVPNYKLKMGASLPGVGNLAGHWRVPVTETLRGQTRRAVVVDLLPQEHARAVELDRLGASELARVEFRSASGRAIGHDAKAVKGMLARHLLEAEDPLDAAQEFSWGPWTASLERLAPGRLAVVVVDGRSAA